MVKNKMRCLITIIFLCSAIIEWSEAAYSTEVDAKIFVKQSSEKLYKLYEEFVENIYLDFNKDNIDAAEAVKKLNLLFAQVKGIAEISKEAQQFVTHNIQDPELIRALGKLKKEANVLILEHDFISLILKTLITSDDLSKEKRIPKYQENELDENQEEREKIALMPEVRDIFMNSRNNKELVYYWKAANNLTKTWVSEHFADSIAGYKKTAFLLGITELQLWYNFYDDESVLNDMENVMMQIKPLYEQLHAYVRKQLHQKYGDEVVTPNGPIPAHLLQQVVLQIWTNSSVIDVPRDPNNVSMQNYDDLLQNTSIDEGRKLFDLAENFYQSLGFSALSDEFWNERTSEIRDEKSVTEDCESEIIAETPRTYIKYCKKVSFRKFLEAHAGLGKLHYAEEMSNLPAYYFDSSVLSYPVGQAAILSASTSAHMATIGFDNEIIQTEEFYLKRNFLTGLKSLLMIPKYFVENKMMHDLLSGTITMESMNKHYWNLMEQYAGVEPPVDRSKGDLDLPMRFFDIFEEDNRQTRQFVAEILGYQFYEALCQKSEYTGVLQNCDFYGNGEAGNALKKMMRLGSSKPWRETISLILSENATLNGQSLINYFAPMQNYLEVTNQEQEVKIGWSPSKRNVH